MNSVSMPANLRSEMIQLAATAPSLENERMQALIRATPSLTDRGLIREIREISGAIGRQANQETPDAISRIEALENKVRLVRQPIAAPSEPSSLPSPPSGPNNIPPPNSGPDNGTPTNAGPNNGAPPNHERNNAPARLPQQGIRQSGPQTYERPALDTILSGLRPTSTHTGAPWDPALTPMRERLTVFEQKMRDGKDEQIITGAEKAANAATHAFQALAATAGGAVLNRINDTAKSAPGGMQEVMSEMREGGRYADLRQQFNTAMISDKATAAAYNNAVAKLFSYGQQRLAVEPVIPRRPDAANLVGRFNQMDAEIGEAASAVPGRKNGASMIDDLTEKVSTLLHRAVDNIKSWFGHAPAADAGRDSSPSPSPG